MGAPQKYATRTEQAEAIVDVLFDTDITVLLALADTIAGAVPTLEAIAVKASAMGAPTLAAEITACANDLKAVTA